MNPPTNPAVKPLLITDCDEVLLHMARHFGAWLGEVHDIDFNLAHHDMATSMKRRDGTALAREEMWTYLAGFFPAEMGRQTLVPYAAESIAALAQIADIVVLTNLQDHCRPARTAQLESFGIVHRVETNQGGKGARVAAIAAEYGNPVAVFVDDLAVHLQSCAEHAPHVHRLHMVSEPQLAPNVPPAPAAHARIDDWREAKDWIAARFAAGVPANA